MLLTVYTSEERVATAVFTANREASGGKPSGYSWDLITLCPDAEILTTRNCWQNPD